ncbi:MAG: hypothetical protein NWR45_07695 [Candidatus Nanopelagicales bacterium]|nr:hypothetical protein [Candidatus Nanopelagicales bacterium]
MNNHINTVKDAATKAAESAATTVKSVANRAPKLSFPTIEIPSEVQSYVDAATKSATETTDSIKSNVTSTVTLLREAVGR